MKRHVPLLTDHFYHVYNKSIFTYTIFNNADEYKRMLQLIEFYRCANMPMSFSKFAKHYLNESFDFNTTLTKIRKNEHPPLVRIHAYCLMPTHTHFLLEQLLPDGICKFMKNIQSGYTQFFNMRHNRRGPLWQNRFGSNVIADDNAYNQIYAYIHANPVKDLGIPDAQSWPYSSASPKTYPLPGSG